MNSEQVANYTTSQRRIGASYTISSFYAAKNYFPNTRSAKFIIHIQS